MIVDKINAYLSKNNLQFNEYIQREVETLAGWSFKRQFMDNDEYDSAGKIHMSSIGKCPRQLAYKYLGFEKQGKEIDGRARINFFFGDLVELVVIKLAKLAGVQLVGTGLDQARLCIPIGDDVEISGYPDGFYIGKEMMTISIKSMPSFRFRDFEKGIIGQEYLDQSYIEMYATKLTKCIFIAICKDNGVFAEQIVKRDDKRIDQLRKNVNSIIKSTTKNLPERKFQANDKGQYPWQCLYCAYWNHCLNAEKVLQGKRYVLKEKTGTISKQQIEEIKYFADDELDKILNHYNIETLKDLNETDFEEAITLLTKIKSGS